VYGVSLALNVFDGFNIRRQTQNARIGVSTSELRYNQVLTQTQADYARAYSRYENRIKILELEQSNLLLARQNSEVALERYRLGLLNALELREAQRSLLIAQNRLADIEYEAKAAETELKRLTGSLVAGNK
jgi:outer membrane protein TolC